MFVSSKTGRGPLSANWLDELRRNAQPATASTRISGTPMRFMCAYKLCRIECAIWGCQSRLEKSVSESVLRHMILMSHRQAWCWQDEYVGLSMDDVRQLELETQLYLMAKMRHDLASIDELDTKFAAQQQQQRHYKRKGSKATTQTSAAVSFSSVSASGTAPGTALAAAIMNEQTHVKYCTQFFFVRLHTHEFYFILY